MLQQRDKRALCEIEFHVRNGPPDVTRLSLGKLLVNLAASGQMRQYPTNFFKKWRRRQDMGFWVLCSNHIIHNTDVSSDRFFF